MSVLKVEFGAVSYMFYHMIYHTISRKMIWYAGPYTLPNSSTPHLHPLTSHSNTESTPTLFGMADTSCLCKFKATCSHSSLMEKAGDRLGVSHRIRGFRRIGGTLSCRRTSTSNWCSTTTTRPCKGQQSQLALKCSNCNCGAANPKSHWQEACMSYTSSRAAATGAEVARATADS